MNPKRNLSIQVEILLNRKFHSDSDSDWNERARARRAPIELSKTADKHHLAGHCHSVDSVSPSTSVQSLRRHSSIHSFCVSADLIRRWEYICMNYSFSKSLNSSILKRIVVCIIKISKTTKAIDSSHTQTQADIASLNRRKIDQYALGIYGHHHHSAFVFLLNAQIRYTRVPIPFRIYVRQMRNERKAKT